MQGYVPGHGVGVKVVNIIPANVQRGLPTVSAEALLLDVETGRLLAILNGTVLTALRTAAACALSVKLLAPRKGGVLTIVGTGYQARYILRFVSTVFQIEKLELFDIDSRRARDFAEYANTLGIGDVVVRSDIACALRESTVVIESTTAKEPVILIHIVSIGVRALSAIL